MHNRWSGRGACCLHPAARACAAKPPPETATPSCLPPTPPQYAEVEHVLCQLITLHGLDRLLKSDKAVEAQAARVEEAVEQACAFVYTKRGAQSSRGWEEEIGGHGGAREGGRGVLHAAARVRAVMATPICMCTGMH